MEKITKENWLRLAMHEEVESRELALEIAKGMREDLQEELVCWFVATPSFKIKLELYDLLTDVYKKIVDQVGNGELPPFLITDSYRALAITDDDNGKIAILEGYADGTPFNKMKLLFIKRYKSRAGLGLRASKDYLDDLCAAVNKYKVDQYSL